MNKIYVISVVIHIFTVLSQLSSFQLYYSQAFDEQFMSYSTYVFIGVGT